MKTELHIKEECIIDEFMDDEVVEGNSDEGNVGINLGLFLGPIGLYRLS